jgi:hypothetical protein
MGSISELSDVAPAGSVRSRVLRKLTERTIVLLPLGELRIFVRFLVFTALLPAGFLLAVLVAVSWKIGATDPSSTLAHLQQERPKLVLVPFGSMPRYAAYKLARIKEVQPDVIYVGQSRCSQVRSAMFEPYSFYNACLTSWTLDQIREFIEHAAAVAKPSIVVFELDYFMFTKEYEEAWTKRIATDFAPDFLVGGLNATLTLAKDDAWGLLANLSPHLGPETEPHTGFQLEGPDSRRAKAGFRYDGSFLYPFVYQAVGAKLLKDAAHQFSSSVHGGPGLDPSQVEALVQLARSASKLGVKLVGIQLPIYATAIDYLDTDPAYHPYAGVWRAFQSDETRRMFERLGITFYDLVRMPENNEADTFVDPAHPSELGILRCLLAMSSDPRFKSVFPLIDPERLRRENEDAKWRPSYDVYMDRF